MTREQFVPLPMPPLPEGWDPYIWHDHHKAGYPRWRVRQGMHEERLRLCTEFDALNQWMAVAPFKSLQTVVDQMKELEEWQRLKDAILACEEFES